MNDRPRTHNTSPPIVERPKAIPGQAWPAGSANPPGRVAASTPDPARQVMPASGATPPVKAVRPITQAKTRKSGDDVYLGQVLNNRFKVESKIGEGGFGAVYRGVQLATGRKVALKLLHPDMTKDENLVARFRREGMVLCNLRDAHTITTYDFDQTPSGTLYIAMELLEGKSLHQVFHEEAPLDWRRVFKILTEMCSSLAEAHTQGIVHRDLKPENIYLEARSGNPEFVKILDFGIAKVMRGETIDPQSPQLTATGQTLGTLEYMSPEQLMGKPLDGRSDVYALGVLAYEMITGRLPFPDAKGPAGLITAQLKQTPLAPSQACPQAMLPRAADLVILKCLEKDKNNRYPDVSALAVALQEVIATQSELSARKQLSLQVSAARGVPAPPELLETRRGELPNNLPPAMPFAAPAPAAPQVAPLAPVVAPGSPAPIAAPLSSPRIPPPGERSMAAPPSSPRIPPPGERSMAAPRAVPASVMTPASGASARAGRASTPYPHSPSAAPAPLTSYPAPALPRHSPASKRRPRGQILWWVLALLAIGAGAGAAAGLLLSS